MDSDLSTPDTDEASRPLRIEIVGVAGSGKTTLTRRLTRMRPDLQAGLRLPKARVYRHLVNRSALLLPRVLSELGDDRWFSWKETKAIMFLEAWERAIVAGAGAGRRAILFDHGPLFWLTRIHEFGPRFMRAGAPRAWWTEEVSRWGRLLDAVVWLDAPDDALVERIRGREKDHIVKHETDERIRTFLRRFRGAFRETMAVAVEGSRPLRYDFDTATSSTEQIAMGVLERVDHLAAARQGIWP